jgi:hypothetical protein
MRCQNCSIRFVREATCLPLEAILPTCKSSLFRDNQAIVNKQSAHMSAQQTLEASFRLSKDPRQAPYHQVLHLAGLLLIRAGIEMNPGPPLTPSTAPSACTKDVPQASEDLPIGVHARKGGEDVSTADFEGVFPAMRPEGPPGKQAKAGPREKGPAGGSRQKEQARARRRELFREWSTGGTEGRD